MVLPPPGTLKKRPVDENEIASTLETQFQLGRNETLTYLRLLTSHDMTVEETVELMGLTHQQAEALLEQMLAKGLVIKAARNPSKFTPLHPRMTLTNIFKLYEKEVVQALRDRRATVDRVVNLLTPIYEERQS